MMSRQPSEIVAAVDLGSNSFHMIVARDVQGDVKVLDRLREPVRLGAGFDAEQNLSDEMQRRALDCLQRFGQRLRDLPPGSVRAVGTNALRQAANAGEFLARAEQALGHPIGIIAGAEEARLIYLGVAHSLAADDKPRLVVDIGGGSTEIIIGAGFTPRHMESLDMGCVSVSQRFFADGTISARAVERALMTARLELEPVEASFRDLGWVNAVGASGTIRAAHGIVTAAGWSSDTLNRGALRKLLDAMIDAGHVNKLTVPGLSAERAPVLPGGVVILLAIFEALDIKQMGVAKGALREGVLYDLLGRIHDHDVRGDSVASLARRHHVAAEHAQRVRQTAKQCLAQVESAWGFVDHEISRWLDWAAQLHEIGLNVSHNQYQQHGAYIIENADLAGFSAQEQKLLALLVRAHRRKFPVKFFKDIPDGTARLMQRLAILLRLAVLLRRGRSAGSLPKFTLEAGKKSLDILFPAGWLDAHPLTRGDLEQEASYLEAVGFELRYR